ncbi:MAG: GNAT family N-acetyltransferase [Chitinophagaceae bacterium]|nr:GNAT family N-acetyltransferase [Chitinophagaceae bacterium]
MPYHFDFSNAYNLENDCVLLRPLAVDDCNNLRYFSQNEPDIWTYSAQKAAGEEALIRYIDVALAARARGEEYPFIVFDKRSNTYAGCTRFYDIQPQHDTLQLGYTWYGKSFQGTGLNRHCKFLLLSFAFDTLGVKRVEFRADLLNKRSIAAMKSIGCVEEGILRSHQVKADGTRRDSIVLSILAQEWADGVRDRLLAQTRIN